MKKFGYKNINQVPRLKKISLNMGVGDGKQDVKLLESAISDLTVIAGQKPAKTRAKKAISNFKLRAGMDIGCRVTLRRKKMFEFGSFISSLFRIRDFKF
jgi:large subunit ribosomal protein L5